MGLAIGVVSSLLRVAGGDLLIPIFVFVFGADIKTAAQGESIDAKPETPELPSSAPCAAGAASYTRLPDGLSGRQSWETAVVVTGVPAPSSIELGFTPDSPCPRSVSFVCCYGMSQQCLSERSALGTRRAQLERGFDVV